jgi:gamma-butyrobetaine dioxygenase
MLKAAALAERAGAAPAPFAAALPHDVGLFAGTITGRDLMAGTDNRHGEQKAPGWGSGSAPKLPDDEAKDPDALIPAFRHFAPSWQVC